MEKINKLTELKGKVVRVRTTGSHEHIGTLIDFDDQWLTIETVEVKNIVINIKSVFYVMEHIVPDIEEETEDYAVDWLEDNLPKLKELVDKVKENATKEVPEFIKEDKKKEETKD